MVICLSLTMMACNNQEENQKEVTNDSTNNESLVKDDTSVGTIDSEDISNSDSEESVASETQEDVELGESDEGIKLVQNMINERPTTMRIVSEITAFNTTTTMTTYYDGDKSKKEIDVVGLPKSILIHLPEEEVMYQYVYGEAMGIKITGADQASAEEMGMMMDTSLLQGLVDGASDDMVARVEELDGEEVIYIEATEADEDVGEMLVKMWYSERYATPLKYEIYLGESMISQLKVTKIHDNVAFNADTFLPPSDVDFQEINMDAMLEMWNEGGDDE
jgi:hypothetical protein